MWFENTIEVLDMVKSNIPVTFFVFVLPFLMVISPVSGAQNFPVYRVNQFDFGGNSYGTRSTLVNMEARAVNSGSITRKCIVARLNEVTLSVYRHLIDQNAGAIVILLPNHEFENLTADLQEQFLALEKLMLTEEVMLPVYFAVETKELTEIYQHIAASANADHTSTATEALLQSVSANGFQMNVHTSAARRLDNHKTINIHGVLEGEGSADRLPTVLIVAHYDAHSAIPGLSFGADSNGSGVAALLELMRVFSRLFSSAAKPNYNMVFLLSGSGKLNYFGTKRWLEEMKDSTHFPYLSEVETVICLDSIGGETEKLYTHVSKLPKEGSANAQILKILEKVAAEREFAVEVVHKKVNLGEVQLAWEHEQFAMNKLTGMTISTLPSHKSPLRTSALDRISQVNRQSLVRNTHMVGEAIARYMYRQQSDGSEADQSLEVLQHDLAVQPSMMAAWLSVLTSAPRAPQLMDKNSLMISSLEQAFTRHLKSVSRTAYTCDKRDPEFVLYDSALDTMHVYSVKPAVFDLVLAAVIATYLGGVYLLSLIYPKVATVLMNKPKRS